MTAKKAAGKKADKPRPRRDYGAHSIYKRADGRWFAAIDHGFTDAGKRRRITVSAATEAEVKVKLRQKLRSLEEAGDAGLSSRTTVKAWSDDWLPMVQRTLRPYSFTSTSSAVRKWVVPTIGHKQLAQLSPADVRSVADKQRKAGLTSSTQRRTHSVLLTMLKAAQAEGHAVPPRVLAVKAPAASVSDRTDLPVDAAVKILGKAAELPHGSRWAAALLQGMRQGEALGLTWDQVDLERGVLVVSWQLQPLPYRVARDTKSGFRIPDGYDARQLDGRLHLVRPKSKSGWRVIPLVPWMTAALKAWREHQEAGEVRNPHGLVWPAVNGSPVRAKADDAEWYALQTEADVAHPAGRAFTVHEARHTTATLLLEAGIDPAVITAILGHSSILTSRGYMHVNTAPLAEAMGRVAERLALG